MSWNLESVPDQRHNESVGGSVAAWDKIIEQPTAPGHFVQFYGGHEDALYGNVARYMGEGLKQSEGLVLIATAAHTEKMLERTQAYGVDPALAARRGQLIVMDAHKTLSQLMLHGQPDWSRFENTIGPVIRDVHSRCDRGLRAFGEMVGVLWETGQLAAAVRLEHLWNRMLNRCPLNLYCAYPIDVFSAEFHATGVDGLLCTHTHVVPGSAAVSVETALLEAVNETGGIRAENIAANGRTSWAVMPRGEAMILWMRQHLAGDSEEVFARAREIYTASHSPQ